MLKRFERNKTKIVLAILLTLLMAVNLVGCNSKEVKPTDNTEINTETNNVETEGFGTGIPITEESTFDKPMQNLPESPYWFPAELLEWSPSQDPDYNYNVSTTPLAERVSKESLTPSNATQNIDMNVVALSIMNSSTSGNAPHGINTFDANVFTYWQYIDKLVYWGGSSGEGIIVAPSADVIDAAHKNGVPVLGTIFFPPTVYGGKIQWLNEFLEKDENGNFPMVDKMIEAADAYGFEGWFINQETEGSEDDENDKLTNEHAVLMQEFIRAFKEKAGDSLEIMWYDAMTIEGGMEWQNALTDQNKFFLLNEDKEKIADSMFLNFWWTDEENVEQELLKASKETAEEWGVDPYSLYAGIDVQANGIMTPIRWDLFEESSNSPYTSLGLYCPSWTYYSAENMDDYLNKESRLWVNDFGNPTIPTQATGTQWRGISTYAIEQTAINKTPFITNFSMGHGYSFFIDGEKVSALDWNNRSIQDIMPTYRWVFEHEGNNKLTPSIDYSNAYYGGNSLKFRGNLDKDKVSTIKLYSTDLILEEGTSFTTIASATSESTLELLLELEDGSVESIEGDTSVGTKWTTITYDVSELAGKTVKSISYALSTGEEAKIYEFNLGQIAVTRSTDSAKTSVAGLTVEDSAFDEEESIYAGVRLAWTTDSAADVVSHYEIYRVNQDGTKSFLGATSAKYHYINALERNDDTNKTNFEVVSININGERGTASPIATMQWPDNSVPKTNFKASKTLVAPGEEVVFESLCSANTESLTWEFDGASIETSEEDSPSVTYDAEGTYNVKLTAKNASGETPLEIEGIITVSKKAADGLVNLSSDKPVTASSFVNDNEAPQFAVDGKVDTKWCATGSVPHDITIDLGEVKAISELHMAHAEAGGEGADMNTKAYSIHVSEDGIDFTQVARVISNSDGETIDTFTAVNARYVKIVVEKPTQGSDTAVRIYEIEVFGLDNTL